MRINKYLASAGVASRRKAEEFISAGKVKVNGKIVYELSTDIKDSDRVSVNGKVVKPASNFVYYKLHKPKGYVSTVSDDKGRKTIMSLMRGVHARIFPVGRLDYDTEGLIILTNDGELSNILTKPNSEIEKKYIVNIEGAIAPDEIKTLSNGVDISDYTTKPCSVQLLDTTEGNSRLAVTIKEGKNRQIRRMFESIGKTITFLKRTDIGQIHLGGLSRGEYAELNSKEMKFINSLKK